MKKMKQKWQVFLLLFLLSATGAFAQISVKGVVKGSDDGQPIPGVIVKVEGSTKGVVTDVNGAYKIDVPFPESKLSFSYVGMATQSVVAGSTGEINISMKAGVEIKEVVVTALGVSRETKSLGYSVSSVSGDAVRESGESNALEALAAKAPGVQVNGSGGSPGASVKIQIRGTNSLFLDNTPLIVVDGVPIDNSVNNVTAGDNAYSQNLAGVNESNRGLDINPDDIETVTILKGAAAAALYGSKGANGAIIYTTKRGKAGKGMTVTYSSSVAIDQVNKLPEQQKTYVQGTWDSVPSVPSGPNTHLAATYHPLLYGPGPAYPILVDPNTGGNTGTANSWGPTAASLHLPTYDNPKNFFKTGVTTNNNVSIAAGTENSGIRLSIGNTHQTGIIPDSKLDRTSIHLNVDHKVNKWLDFGGGVTYSNTQTEKAQNGSNLSGVMLSLMRNPINFDVNNSVLPNGNQRQYYTYYDNTLWGANNNPFTDETNRIMGNFFVNIKPTEHITLTSRTGVDAYTTNNQQIYAVGSEGDDLTSGLGQVNRTNIDNRQIYQDLLLKYNKQITENFGLGVMGGYNFFYEEASSVYTRGRNLLIPGFYNFSNAASLYTSNLESYQHSNAGLADISLDYKRAIYLDIAGRNEWNSSFGRNGKSFFYPKADLSWVFSETIKLPKWFSFGKVRGSFASVGKAPAPYSTTTGYAAPLIADGYTNGLTFPYNGNPAFGISNTLNDPALKPEKTNEIEGGTDLRFFDSRVTLDLSVYSRKTTDVLILLPVAPSSGYSYKFTNFAEIDNKGTEIMLGLVPVKMKDFNWTIMTNWSKNVNTVAALPPGVTAINLEQGFGDPQSVAIANHPVGSFYGTAWERDGSGNLLINSSGLPIKNPINQVVGNPNPDWLAGINNIFKYKNITFSFLWDIRHGGQIWNGTLQSLNSRGMSAATENRGDAATNPFVIPGVYAPGTPGHNAGEKNTTGVNGFDYYNSYLGLGGASENSIQDGGWIRLRSVNLSYRINFAKPEKKTLVQYVELGVSARNLFLHTKYTGVDPETSLTGAGSQINGWDYFNNPNTKSYMFNLKVGL
jgi:TonB-linked SusC/RagA family outer membrane protein